MQSAAIAKTGGMTMFDFKNQTQAFWQKHLKSEVYNICRESGTERAFSGEYDKFYEKGTYHCNCCGGDHPLFASETKYDSGTGWPSFWTPITKSSVTLTEEKRLFNIL